MGWSRAWFTAELARGRTFDDIRYQYNAAGPLLCSLANAMDTTDQAQTDALCDAIARAYERVAAMAEA